MLMDNSMSIKRLTVQYCKSQNPDGSVLISWPVKRNVDGYIVTKTVDGTTKEIMLDNTITKYVDDVITKANYKVEAYRKVSKIKQKDLDGLCGSLEQAQIKSNNNTKITDYIVANFSDLVKFVSRIPHVDKSLADMLITDVWISWSKKEEQGIGYSAERIGKNGERLSVQQVVENSIKSYARNETYTNRYNNRDKKDGVDIELHSVSMMEEHDEYGDSNVIMNQASMQKMSEVSSPLDMLVEADTLREDLEYVLEKTKDFDITARSIFDNINALLEMVQDKEDKKGVSNEVLRSMNKTLFSEYQSDLCMVDMFSRIFTVMQKDSELFNRIYKAVTQPVI